MNEALDELIQDYAVYYNSQEFETPLSFIEWCNDPVLCDQELLAQTGLLAQTDWAEAQATIRDLRLQLGATLTALQAAGALP